MAWIRSCIIFVCLFLISVLAERARFDNYKIYQILPKTDEHLKFLKELESKSDAITFLTLVPIRDKPVNVLVAPHKQPDFCDALNLQGISHKVAVENFQKVLDKEQAELNQRSSEYDWKSYHTLNETYNWLWSLEKRFPDVVMVDNVGKSFEGRDILGVIVSFKPGNKGIFLEGGIHAREWISPAVLTYILNELLTSEDPVIREMAQKYDWYIFPHTNPDGFVYTHTTNRLWRKTRSNGIRCYGADPNRNWDFHWNEVGTSSDECSDLYAGKAPFSEIEMKRLAEYIDWKARKIQTYLSFHNYGQMILFPYSYTDSPAPNHDDHQAIGDAAAAALRKRYGTEYVVGNSYTTIYPTAGSSDDWVYGVQNIKLSYTLELRPQSGVNAFVVPSAQIIPTALETLDALVALTAKAEELGYYD